MLTLLLFLSILGSPKESFDLALGLYRDGVFRLAREEFQNHLNEYPDSPYQEKAEYYIASSDFYLEDYKLACEELGRFISTYPSSSLIKEARQQLARSYFELGDYKESIAIYKILDTPDSKYWLGECYYSMGQLDTALSYYKKVPEESRYVEYAIYSFGYIERERGRSQEALGSFDRLVTEYPESPLRDAALYYSGRIYFEMGDYQTAEDRLLQVRDRYKEDAALFLGHIYFKLGLYDKAKEKYSSLISGKYHAAAILGLGDIKYVLGNLDEALQEYRKIENIENMRDEVYMRIGRVYFDKRQYEEALNWFNKVESPESKLMVANTLFELGRYQEAFERYMGLYREAKEEEALYRASLSAFKNGSTGDAEYLALEYINHGYEEYVSEVHLILGELYFSRGDYVKAIAEYNSARKDHAIEKQALLGLAYTYLKTGDRESSIKTLSTLVGLYPENDIFYKAAEIAYSLKEYTKAVTWFNKVEGADYNLGKVYYDMGRYKEAIEAFERYATEFPMSRRAEEALFLMGLAERQMQNYKESISAFDELLKLYPSTDYAYDAILLIGDDHFDMGKYDEAISSYKKAIALQPKPLSKDAVNAIYGILDAEYRARGLASTLSLASDYIKTNPNIKDEIYIKMGDLAFQSGDQRRAIDYYKSIKSNELLPRALYWLGMSYYSLDDINMAEETFVRLIGEFPEDGLTTKALIILSDIYLERKDYRKAEQYLLNIKNDEGRLRLSEVYIEEGRNQDAENVLKGLLNSSDEGIKNKSQLKLAYIDIKRGDTEVARDYLSSVLSGKDELLKPEARLLEGDSYYEEGNYESAARSYLMVNYLYGENDYISKALFKAADCYTILNKTDEAKNFYTMVIERDDDSLLVRESKSKLEALR